MSAAPATEPGSKAPAEDTAEQSAPAPGRPYALLTPGMLWLAIFFVVPTLVMIWTSV